MDDPPETIRLIDRELMRLRTGRHTHVRIRVPDFGVTALLSEDGADDTLVPLHPTGAGPGQSKVKFTLRVTSERKDFRADVCEIEIRRGKTVLFKESYPHNFCRPGSYDFWWDGYSKINGGVLDTELLKGRLTFRATLKRLTLERVGRVELDNEAEEVAWCDACIDRDRRQISVKVYVDCQRNGMTRARFQRLEQLVHRGIEQYWSRPITIAGKRWQVRTKVVERESDCVVLDLYEQTGEDYARSHNSGIIDASIFYNTGFFRNYGGLAASDLDFQLTAAHEFGHSVLEAFGGKELSWGHKGTVNDCLLAVWNFQSVKDTAPVWPPSGPIDLMKYYREPRPLLHDRARRTLAAEEDVKRLIWAASVDFDYD